MQLPSSQHQERCSSFDPYAIENNKKAPESSTGDIIPTPWYSYHYSNGNVNNWEHNSNPNTFIAFGSREQR